MTDQDAALVAALKTEGGWMRCIEAAARIEAWEQVWDCVRIHVPDLRENNKPLAVAASYELLWIRATAAEAALAERDKLLLLVKEALGDWEDGTGEQHTHYCPNCDNSIDGSRKIRDAIDAAMQRATAAEAALAQAVPREPTEAMLEVGVDACPLLVRERYANGAYTGTRASLSSDILADIWRAMYDAAPAAPRGR